MATQQEPEHNNQRVTLTQLRKNIYQLVIAVFLHSSDLGMSPGGCLRIDCPAQQLLLCCSNSCIHVLRWQQTGPKSLEPQRHEDTKEAFFVCQA